jgi:glutathione synthase
MRVVFFVNDLETEEATYTTTRLARAATARGHEVWYVGAEDLCTLPDSSLIGNAARVPSETANGEELLEAIQTVERSPVDLQQIDVFWLRNNPADDAGRPWAQRIGIDIAHLLADRGITVLNDPDGLERAANKMYVQLLPESVRPRTLITHDVDDIRDFMKQEGADIVLKPLHGSGGDGVFFIKGGDNSNLNQIFESVARSGYVVAQQYMPEAAAGDIRMFLLNGRPLEVQGRYACFRRVSSDKSDLRNNMSVGGKAEPVEMDEALLGIAEAVRPKLIEDGMFLVGLDIAGSRILEVNVFSPGGLGSCEHFGGVDFCGAVIDAVEAKCQVVSSYDRTFTNAQIAVL